MNLLDRSRKASLVIKDEDSLVDFFTSLFDTGGGPRYFHEMTDEEFDRALEEWNNTPVPTEPASPERDEDEARSCFVCEYSSQATCCGEWRCCLRDLALFGDMMLDGCGSFVAEKEEDDDEDDDKIIKLNRSYWSEHKDFKSCPHCSVLAGELVWYPTESFGTREQPTGVIIQSWCPKCRKEATNNSGKESEGAS